MLNIIIALLLLLALPAFGQIAGYPDFEIVESTPIETSLDNPDVRDAHEVWLEMINRATTALDIEEFYISNQAGEPLDDVIKAIMAAADRGVKVRLIADSRMYKTYPETIDLLGKHNNITSRIIDFGKLSGGVQHAKFFIVDGQEIFFGSQNFDWRALKHIHELGVLIKHRDAVKVYGDVFDLDWALAQNNDPSMIKNTVQLQHYPIPFHLREGEDDTITFFPTMSPKGLIGDSLIWDEVNIVNLINRASKDVFCQVLTYSPMGRDKKLYSVLDEALRHAAARGVKVRMIVADWGKATEAEKYLKDLSRVANIEVKFSDIPEWSGGYVSFARVEHCKYLVIDSMECWLGTSNWEKSYFYNTRNLGVVAKSPKIAGILRTIFLKSWDGPYTELIKPAAEYKARKHGEK